ncbi:MAG: hypothetical protein LBU55_04810 [Elusimicrobiota bacterium]|jgi:DNA-binding phage protein|nr:hypothetical protein [Elusimicrobiota bacterium]
MKKNKIKMKNFKNYDEFRKVYFAENPQHINIVKKEIIKEYVATPEMDIADLLCVLRELLKLSNITKLPDQAELSREHLKAISTKGNPTIHTVAKIANKLGYRLTLMPI